MEDDIAKQLYQMGYKDGYKNGKCDAHYPLIKDISDNVEKRAKELAFEELINTKHIQRKVSLKDISQNAVLCDFDAGWLQCYKDFCEINRQIRERNNV